MNTAELINDAKQEQHNDASAGTAFGELVNLYGDRLYGFVYTRVRDPFLARDIVQESFIRAFTRLETLREGTAFGAWLRTIALRTCSKMTRGNTERQETVDPDTIASTVHAPEYEWERSEKQRAIDSALDSLSECNRVPFVLYYLDGQSVADIAEFLDLAPTTVRKRLQRSRDALKKEMQTMIRKEMLTAAPTNEPDFMQRINLAASFSQAARLGQLCLVEAMLTDGVDVNAPDIKGRTLLHWAAAHGHREIVDLLVRCGANPGLRDRGGRTPRDSAVAEGFPEIADMLLRAAASRS